MTSNVDGMMPNTDGILDWTQSGDPLSTPRCGTESEESEDVSEGRHMQVLPSTPRLASSPRSYQPETPRFLSESSMPPDELRRLLKHHQELLIQQIQASFSHLGLIVEDFLAGRAEEQPADGWSLPRAPSFTPGQSEGIGQSDSVILLEHGPNLTRARTEPEVRFAASPEDKQKQSEMPLSPELLPVTIQSSRSTRRSIHPDGRMEDVMKVVTKEQTNFWDPVMKPFKQVSTIKARKYELIISLLVAAHIVYLGIHVQYNATLQERASDADAIFQVCSTVFCILFILDLVYRICTEQWKFLEGPNSLLPLLNFIDVFLVLLMTIDQAIILIDAKSHRDGHFSILHSVRFAQPLRILRGLRMMPVVPVFRECRIVVFSIVNSCVVFVWIMVVMSSFMYFGALFFMQGTIELCVHGSANAVCEQFGAIDRAMLTLYEAILSGVLWGPVLESLGEIDYIYSMVLLVFVVFGRIVIVNIAMGMVIGVQAEATKLERPILIQDAMQKRNKYVKTMTHIFQEIDMNDSGSISKEELELALEDQTMDAFLASLRIDMHDVQAMIDLFDADGSGALDIEEFIMGCLRIRGDATALDVVRLQHECEHIKANITELRDLLLHKGTRDSELHRLAAEICSCCSANPALASAMLARTARSEAMQSITHVRGGEGEAKHKHNHQPTALREISNTSSAFVTDPGSYDKKSSLSSSLFSRIPKRRRSKAPSSSSQLIRRVEDRAMTLKDLLQVRQTISKHCTLDRWTDAATGKLLSKEAVNLYHFNYHCICPKTLPQGVLLHGLQPGKFVQHQQVEQIDPDGEIRIIGQGFIKSDADTGCIHIEVNKGRFVGEKECQGLYHVWVDGVDVGVPASVELPLAMSYKEVLSPAPRKPKWFCSHWWGEAVLDFVACCEKHAELRRLSQAEASYWVCAYANRQHELGLEINVPLESCSFAKALKEAKGVLLFLDPTATAMTRMWCNFELYNTLSDSSTILDIVTVPQNRTEDGDRRPLLLTEGLLPRETTDGKRRREQNFPMGLLATGMRAKLEEGKATKIDDKERILKHMAKQFQKGGLNYETALELALEQANSALNATFAQAAWGKAVRMQTVCDFDPESPGTLSLPDILVKDEQRKIFMLNLSHLDEVNDTELQSVARGLPPNLQQLGLCFESCNNISDVGVRELMVVIGSRRSLRHMHLDFLGCKGISDAGVRAVAKHLPESVIDLRLDFAKCTKITAVGAMYLANHLESLKLQKCVLTLRGTKVNQNFASKTEIMTRFKG